MKYYARTMPEGGFSPEQPNANSEQQRVVFDHVLVNRGTERTLEPLAGRKLVVEARANSDIQSYMLYKEQQTTAPDGKTSTVGIESDEFFIDPIQICTLATAPPEIAQLMRDMGANPTTKAIQTRNGHWEIRTNSVRAISTKIQ